MKLLSISEEKCRQCLRCVRACPTNALQIDRGKVSRIENRCIFCGACYKYCPHNAVIVYTGADKVLSLLEKGKKVVVCLDSTYPAVLDKGTPGQLVYALKKAGFLEVWESAYGGDLVTSAYREWLSQNKKLYVISSFCPSIVLYIEKFAPKLINLLAPIISPMTAIGRMVKRLRGDDVKVVFIGSCISRIYERRHYSKDSGVDYVLTYHDLPFILNSRGIDREAQPPSDFDGPKAHLGGILSIAGGLSKCLGFNQDLINLDFVVEGGGQQAIRAIQQFQDGTVRSRFLDILFCKGCIDGPIVDKNISGPSRKQLVVNHVKAQSMDNWRIKNIEKTPTVNLNYYRHFTAKNVTLPEPDESEIKAVLKTLNKTYPERNLDCGACGYNSCREKAVAVAKGFADIEMCHHYLLEQGRVFYKRLDKSHKQLRAAHEELEHTQRQLIQTEKMASLGQLAAGVAHELNNPLGTIVMFARILQKELSDDEQKKHDIELIIQEADRAAKIVKDLLSFSRETKVKPGFLNINSVIKEALTLLMKQPLFHNIKVKKALDPSIPTTFADPDLLKQVILNIVLNGAQSMEGNGVLTLKSYAVDNSKVIQLCFGDTGKGISQEHIHRLFDPFFTTREKGTGLGLAIVYGIISKHQGKIQVQSEVSKGTTFIITLPVLDQEAWRKRELLDTKTIGRHGGKTGETQKQDLIG